MKFLPEILILMQLRKYLEIDTVTLEGYQRVYVKINLEVKIHEAYNFYEVHCIINPETLITK